MVSLCTNDHRNGQDNNCGRAAAAAAAATLKMPSATHDSHGVPGVAAAAAFLDDLLQRAESLKQTSSIEPPLDKSDFDHLRRLLGDALGYEIVVEDPGDSKRMQRFAVIETAVRDTFKSLIV